MDCSSTSNRNRDIYSESTVSGLPSDLNPTVWSILGSLYPSDRIDNLRTDDDVLVSRVIFIRVDAGKARRLPTV